MPILRINSDGTVRIARKSGADVKDVRPEDLVSYNPALLEDYNKIVEQKKVFESGGKKTELTEKEAGAETLINQLFDLYYGKEGEQSLALVKPGEYRLPAQLKSLETKFKAGEASSVEERIYKYNRILESKRAKLAKAAGDAGNLALQEQILAGKGLPGVDSTPNEAETLFASAYDSFAGGKKPERLIKKMERTGGVLSPEREQIPGGQEGNGRLKFRQEDNPLLYIMAKAQEGLAQSEALPLSYGIIGKILGRGSSASTGAGAAGGEYLKQLLQPGQTIQERGLRTLIPSKERTTSIAKTGATYGVLDFLFTGGKGRQTPLRPIKFLEKIRADIAAKSTAKISGEKIAEAAIKTAENASPSQRKTMARLAMETIDKYSGKNISLTQAVKDKAASWWAGYTAKQAGKGATAGFERSIGHALKEEIAKISKPASSIDSILSAANRTNKSVGGLFKKLIFPAAVGGAAGYAGARAAGAAAGE